MVASSLPCMNTPTIGLPGAIAQTHIQAPEKVKYVLYARKSTESDEKQALSVDSQIKEMLQIAEREGLEIVDIRRESHSAKDSGQRPVFNEMIKDIRSSRYTGILTWAPDRLSRNAGDLGVLVDLMDQKLLVEVRTFGQRFTNSPSEKFLLMILGAQGKLENDQKSVNVKRGLRMRVEMGLWPSTAPTGYLNEKRIDRKGYVMTDPERSSVIKQMFEKVAYEKWSGRKIYHWLKFDLNFRTKSNHHLSLSNVYLILQNHFYYGIFEFPRKSGNWYTGKHQPIINQALFDGAQEQLKRDILKHESKEFAFTKLMKCGLCGSGITADEKFKNLVDGSTRRHVYYGCTKSKDKNCKCGYISEESLIEQLVKIIDDISLDELGIKKTLEEDIKKYYKFKQIVLGLTDKDDLAVKEIDIKNYVKYILKEGRIFEKRDILDNLKSRLVLKEKQIYLEK